MYFFGLRIITLFIWSITYENTFFSSKIKFRSKFVGYVNKYYAINFF